VDTDGVELGVGVIVYPHAVIGPEVLVGDTCAVLMGAIVGHESRLGRGCVVAPGAVINARVQLGDGVYVGCNAAILPEVRVGAWATIGAGSVAMSDVPAGATLMGVPGRVVLPAEVKLKMGEFNGLPQELRPQLQDQVRGARATPPTPTAPASPLPARETVLAQARSWTSSARRHLDDGQAEGGKL
jgi:serine acetyltransferase